MRTIQTADLTPGSLKSTTEQLHVYNGPRPMRGERPILPVGQIPLTKGFVAFVDEEDHERISNFLWTANVQGSYVRAIRSEGRRRFYMHHEVLRISTADLNGLSVDHIDRNPLNNRKENLRIVTHHENMQNSSRALNRVGVCFNKRARLWCAYLDAPNQKRKYLGYHKTREAAEAAVAEARQCVS